MWADGSRIESGEGERHVSGSQPVAGPGTATTSEKTKRYSMRRRSPPSYQALRVLGRRQESEHRSTVFVDSTAAIDRVRNDALSPGQRFAVAAMEVCNQVPARSNEVTIRWVPAYSRVAGNEQADTHAKAAARRTAPHNDDDDVPDELLAEASLSHMSRSTTEARSHATAEWIASHVRPERRYRPPPGRGPATGTCGVQRKSWPGGITSSSPAIKRLGRTSREWKRSTRIGAGFAIPASVSPDSPRGQVCGLGRPGTSHVEEDWEAVREERDGDPARAGDVRRPPRC